MRKFARSSTAIIERADRILKEQIDKLHAMAKALMKYETIDSDQIKDIMDGIEPREPKDWSDHSVDPKRPTTAQPQLRPMTRLAVLVAQHKSTSRLLHAGLSELAVPSGDGDSQRHARFIF